MTLLIIKTALFFFALCVTIAFIEDAIEKIILHSKRDVDDLHLSYTRGFLSTFDGWLWGLTCLFWTGFYVLSQL